MFVLFSFSDERHYSFTIETSMTCAEYAYPRANLPRTETYHSCQLTLYIAVYSWIRRPLWADNKVICQRTRRVTTTPRPPFESSWREEFRSSGFRFLWSVFGLLFFKTSVEIWSQQKGTWQIWICPIEYSSAEVFGPSEVPRINGKSFC